MSELVPWAVCDDKRLPHLLHSWQLVATSGVVEGDHGNVYRICVECGATSRLSFSLAAKERGVATWIFWAKGGGTVERKRLE